MKQNEENQNLANQNLASQSQVNQNQIKQNLANQNQIKQNITNQNFANQNQKNQPSTKHHQASWLRYLLLAMALLAVFCQSDLPPKAQGYMVRGILIEEQGSAYTVAVLYQNPEAAANSADVQAPIKLVKGKGATLPLAFQALEQQASTTLSYALSESLFICGQCSKQTLEAYAKQVQTDQRGRYAASLWYLSTTIAQVEQMLQTAPAAAQTLLQHVQQLDAPKTYLYHVANKTVIMPSVTLQADGTMSPQETMYALGASGGGQYSPLQTQLYYLLSDNNVACDFAMGGQVYTIGNRISTQTGALAGVDTQCNPLGARNTASESKRLNGLNRLKTWNKWASNQDMQQGISQDHLQNMQQKNLQMIQQNKVQENMQTIQQNTLPTVTIYATIQQKSMISSSNLKQLERTITALANAMPIVLEQVGVSAVEVHLVNLANWCG